MQCNTVVISYMLFYGGNTLLLSQKNAQLASTHGLCHQFNINIHESSDCDIGGVFCTRRVVGRF